MQIFVEFEWNKAELCSIDSYLSAQTHEKAEVIGPYPAVGRVDLAQPRRLKHCADGGHTDVGHGRVGQSERHADPLDKHIHI